MLLQAAAFVEMLAPIAVVEAADDNTPRGGGVGKETVLEVDTHVRDSALAIGEENNVAFAELALGNQCHVLLNIVCHTMKAALVYVANNVSHKGGAVYTFLSGAAIAVWGSHP